MFILQDISAPGEEIPQEVEDMPHDAPQDVVIGQD